MNYRLKERLFYLIFTSEGSYSTELGTTSVSRGKSGYLYDFLWVPQR